MNYCKDKSYVNKRTKEILKESRQLTTEIMKAVSKMSKKGGWLDIETLKDIDELIEDRDSSKNNDKE